MSQTVTSLQRKVFFNTSSLALSQIFVSVLGIFVLKIMTTSLGLESYGTYATIYAFVSAFSLLTDLGLNAVTARDVAKSPQETTAIISYNMGLRLFLCLLMIPLIFAVSLLVYPHADHALRIGILLFSLYLVMDAVRSVSLAYFVSQVRNQVVASINALQQIIQLGLVGVAAYIHSGVIGYVLIFLINNIIIASLSFALSRKAVRIRPKINFQKWLLILKSSVSLGLIQIVNMLYLKADLIILSSLAGASAVGIYNISYSLILAFNSLPGFILIALMPRMSVSNTAEMVKLIQKTLQYLSILACLLAVGAFTVKSDLVALVSSASYAKAAVPFAILAFGTAISYLGSVYGYASVSLNKHHKIILVSIGALIINVVLNYAMIPHYGISGAALATALTEVLVVTASALLFKYQTKIHVDHLRPLIKPLISAGLVFVSTQFLRQLWSTPSHLLNILIASLFIIGIYGGLLIGLRGLPTELTDIIKRSRAKLHSR